MRFIQRLILINAEALKNGPNFQNIYWIVEMEAPVILILVGVFAVVAIAQIVTLKSYLKHRREEFKK